MARSFFQFSILILMILLFSCRKERIIRNVYWSESMSNFNMKDNIEEAFYLGYYIELADTGDVKVMIRQKLSGNKEFYKIKLSESLKNKIMSLASQDSIYFFPVRDSNETIVYSGFTYHLHFVCDTTDKSISFIKPVTFQIHKRLINIMDSIAKNPSVLDKTNMDLKQYEMQIKKESPINYQPPIHNSMKFSPSKIK